ncbi:D-galactoside-specific lectin-like [Hydractinia symbiolongicarpus]|uniref:D-galactoside-specific lectin-like n=1 Tax=Hydractinia symbiolongicarpus TaxID=13093 RepID=UPI0025509EEF|nr:D-galactoside-specific lectin-like [Hydractinia symbiolongicarpus]
MKFTLFLLLLTCMCAAVECNCTEVICEKHSTTINCSPGGVIKIIDAFYGRRSKNVCPGRGKDQHCTSLRILKKLDNCNNKQSCSIKASNDDFGDPCEGIYKYAEVVYNCSYATEKLIAGEIKLFIFNRKIFLKVIG